MVVEITKFLFDHHKDDNFENEAIEKIISLLPKEHANREFAKGFLHVIKNENIELNDGYEVNLLLHIVCKDGKLVDLTPYEVRIFEVLAKAEDHTLTFDEISDKVWHYKQDVCNIRVNVNNIRNKMGREIIQNIKGKGYRLNA